MPVQLGDELLLVDPKGRVPHILCTRLRGRGRGRGLPGFEAGHVGQLGRFVPDYHWVIRARNARSEQIGLFR